MSHPYPRGGADNPRLLEGPSPSVRELAAMQTQLQAEMLAMNQTLTALKETVGRMPGKQEFANATSQLQGLETQFQTMSTTLSSVETSVKTLLECHRHETNEMFSSLQEALSNDRANTAAHLNQKLDALPSQILDSIKATESTLRQEFHAELQNVQQPKSGDSDASMPSPAKEGDVVELDPNAGLSWAEQVDREEILQASEENQEIPNPKEDVKIPKFRDYSDDSLEAADQWLTDFIDVLYDARVSKQRWPLAVTGYLKGSPLTWYHRYRTVNVTYTWSEFKSSFLRNHMELNPGSTARRKVKQITFKDMDSYIESFKKALLLAPVDEFTNAEWIDRFCEKLPSRYHDLVRDVSRQGIKILDNLFEEAKAFEAANKVAREATSKVIPTSNSSVPRFNAWRKPLPRPLTLHATARQGSNAVGRRPHTRPKPSFPQKFDKPKQRSANDPLPVADAATLCYECRQLGHFARDCPKRQRRSGMHVMAAPSTPVSSFPLPKLTVLLPEGIQAFMLADTGASHNYVAGDFIAFLQDAGVYIPVIDVGREVIQTATGEMEATSKRALIPISISGLEVTFDAYIINLHGGCDFSLIAGHPFLSLCDAKFSWSQNGYSLHLTSGDQTCRIDWNSSSETTAGELMQISSAPSTKEIDPWEVSLAARFPSLFSGALSTDPSCRAKVKHEIVLTDPHPIRQPPRRRSPMEDRAIKDFVDESLLNGTIRRSNSPWSSPVHIVPKPDGKMRVTIDYRALNRVTRRDAYPIPRADDSLNLLADSSYYTSLDFLNGFWQIPMKEEHKKYTAFSCRYGHFEWNVMPMGLTNAPATFQRAMNDVLAPFIDKCCIVYLDDITIFSPTLEAHRNDVEKVCQTLESAGFVLSLHKCHFVQEEVKMLGHIIDGKSVKPNPAKIEAISTWPTPNDITDVRGFLNVCGFYRRFVKDFAGIADPLYALTEGSPRRRSAINWTNECQAAFDNLRSILQGPAVLALPQLDKRYYLETDASDFAIGAVLSQVRRDWVGRGFDDKELPPKTALKPIAFFSKRLTRTERNYSARERELLGGIASMEHHRCFIEGAPGGFTWVTDHKGIVYFRTQRELTPREYRYLDKIEQYDPTIIYRRGEDNIIADALSRRSGLPNSDQPSDQPLHFMATRRQDQPTELEMLTQQEGDGELIASESAGMRVRAKLRGSESITLHYKALEIASAAVRGAISVDEGMSLVDLGGFTDTDIALALSKAESWVEQLTWRDDKLYWIAHAGYELPVIGNFDQACSISIALHDETGHRAKDALCALIQERYMFPLFRKVAEAVIATCITCQVAKNPERVQNPLHPLPRMDAFERWGLDFLTLPRSIRGNAKLLTAIDYGTGQAHAFPCKSESSEDAVQAVNQLIDLYGKPSSLVCDNGPAWVSTRFRTFCQPLGIRILYASPYHPQTNGKVERFNGLLLKSLKRLAYQHQTDWDNPLLLNQVMFGYRATKSSMTGHSPFFLMYGRHPRFRHQATNNPQTEVGQTREQELRIRSTRAQRFAAVRALANIRAKQLMDRRALLRERNLTGPEISVGDLVLARNRLDRDNKLSPPWSGPYLVSDITPQGAAELTSRRGRVLRETINVIDLKLATTTPQDRSAWFPRPPPQQPSYIGETNLRRWDRDDNVPFPQPPTTLLPLPSSVSPSGEALPLHQTRETSMSPPIQGKGKEKESQRFASPTQTTISATQIQLPVSLNEIRRQAGLSLRRSARPSRSADPGPSKGQGHLQ